MYLQLSIADLAVKKPFYADGEVFSQNERSSPICLQRSFLTGSITGRADSWRRCPPADRVGPFDLAFWLQSIHLSAGTYGMQRGCRSDCRFAAADIALQQAHHRV